MFAELPKLFDRNFAVGFFLPVAIFIAISGLILSRYGFAPQVTTYLNISLLIGTTILGILSWVGGIVLVAINRELYRLLEGYGKFNPISLLKWLEVRRYRRLVTRSVQLDEMYLAMEKDGIALPPSLRTERRILLHRLAEEFPDREEFIMPTPFGNVLRSFEIYSRVMYGLESIDAWGRLLCVIPKEYMALLDAARAQVDFWVNLGFITILLLVEYISLAFITWTPLQAWHVLLLIALGTIAPLRATGSAKQWGDLVKSSFDVYRFKLLESLGVDMPSNRDEEKKLWTRYSQAIMYRIPDALPELKKPGPEPAMKSSSLFE
jgi:hypothetical protein